MQLVIPSKGFGGSGSGGGDGEDVGNQAAKGGEIKYLHKKALERHKRPL